MASITPITAYQDTQQSSTSTTLVSANCATAALANGVDYAVIYRGNCGGSDTSAVPELSLYHGSTEVANSLDEGRGLDNHWDSAQCQGVLKVTGNGTDTLNFQFRTSTASDTAYAGSMSIIAIPLNDLTEGVDYFFAGTNSSTAEVTDATVGGWDTQRSETFSLPDAGDYLVLMSNEANTDAGTNAEASLTRFRVAGATIGSEFHQEWEDDTGWVSYSIAYVASGLSAGNNTFAVEVGSRNAATCNFRRSNIFVLRLASFNQYQASTDSTGATSSSSTFGDFAALNTTFAPNQSEYVLVLGHVVLGCSTTDTATCQVYNNDDATAFNVDAGEYENDNGFDTNRDQVPTLLAYCGQYSASKSWRVQYRANAGTAAIGRNPAETAGVFSTLICLGLTTVEAAEEPQPIFFGTGF